MSRSVKAVVVLDRRVQRGVGFRDRGLPIVASVLVAISVAVGPDVRSDSLNENSGDPDTRLVDAVLISSADREDIEVFKRMLHDALRGSPTMRRVLVDLGADTDPANAIVVVLARSAPGIFIDSYERKLIDLDDLEKLPSAHEPSSSQNAITREEQLVHVLAERRHAARLVAQGRRMGQALSGEQVFMAAHEVGLVQENSYRAERGQIALIDAASHAVNGAPDEAVIEYRLADGTACIIVTSHHGRIDRIIPPRAPHAP